MKRVIACLLSLGILLGSLLMVGCPASDDGSGTASATTTASGGGNQPTAWADSLDTE